jgi:UDP-N-acetylglucosamine:LPS N-acetylglucosamine transferase
MSRKKVHFAMIEAGGGHRSPALAVHEALEELYPGKYEVRILDFMKDLGCTDLDDMHKRAWKYLLSHPDLTKGIQAFDFITGPVNVNLYKLFLERFSKYVMRYLYEEKPDLVFSTHYFNTMGMAYIRKRYDIGPVLVNYLTEIFDFDSYWHLKTVDYYLVASERARQKLLKTRFPGGKLFVFPYPVRPSFLKVDREPGEVLAELGLDETRKTMLITLGSEGIGPLFRMLDGLIRENLPLNVIFVAGKNQDLKDQIERELGSGSGETRLLTLGFVENLNELIQASDFCFIKPGPATTWEVLSFQKPILFFASAQLSENPNIRYVVDNRLGYFVGNSVRKLNRKVRALLEGPPLDACLQAYAGLELRNGAYSIAAFLDDVLEGGHPVPQQVEIRVPRRLTPRQRRAEPQRRPRRAEAASSTGPS